MRITKRAFAMHEGEGEVPAGGGGGPPPGIRVRRRHAPHPALVGGAPPARGPAAHPPAALAPPQVGQAAGHPPRAALPPVAPVGGQRRLEHERLPPPHDRDQRPLRCRASAAALRPPALVWRAAANGSRSRAASDGAGMLVPMAVAPTCWPAPVARTSRRRPTTSGRLAATGPSPRSPTPVLGRSATPRASGPRSRAPWRTDNR